MGPGSPWLHRASNVNEASDNGQSRTIFFRTPGSKIFDQRQSCWLCQRPYITLFCSISGNDHVGVAVLCPTIARNATVVRIVISLAKLVSASALPSLLRDRNLERQAFQLEQYVE